MASSAGLPSVAGMTASSPLSAAGPVQAELAPIRPEGYFGGIRLLAADARVATLLLEEARCRAMERLFGIPRDEKSGLATVIALATLAGALRARMPNRPSRPGVSDLAFGFGLLRESAYDVAGPWSRESSYFGTLLAFALLGAGARFAVRGPTRRVRAVTHEAYAEFHHRYGHLIRPNRRGAAAAPLGSSSDPVLQRTQRS